MLRIGLSSDRRSVPRRPLPNLKGDTRASPVSKPRAATAADKNKRSSSQYDDEYVQESVD